MIGQVSMSKTGYDGGCEETVDEYQNEKEGGRLRREKRRQESLSKNDKKRVGRRGRGCWLRTRFGNE